MTFRNEEHMASLESELICHAILKAFHILKIIHRCLFARAFYKESIHVGSIFYSMSCDYESSFNLAVLSNIYFHVLVGDWQLLLDKNRFVSPACCGTRGAWETLHHDVVCYYCTVCHGTRKL